MSKKNNQTITISTTTMKISHYAVGFNENGKIVRITLPQKSSDKAIAEITSHYPTFKLSNEYLETARKICDIYQGKEVDFDIEQLELNIGESTIQYHI